MKATKVITYEGHRYKITMNIQKISESSASGFLMNFKVNGKMLKVPVNNDTELSDKEVQVILQKAAPVALKAAKEFIKANWSEWMDGEYSDVLSNEMIQDLFDTVGVVKFNNGKIYIEFWLNAKYTAHKYSRAFFGSHSLTAGGYYENGKFILKNVNLEG